MLLNKSLYLNIFCTFCYCWWWWWYLLSPCRYTMNKTKQNMNQRNIWYLIMITKCKRANMRALLIKLLCFMSRAVWIIMIKNCSYFLYTKIIIFKACPNFLTSFYHGSIILLGFGAKEKKKFFFNDTNCSKRKLWSWEFIITGIEKELFPQFSVFNETFAILLSLITLFKLLGRNKNNCHIGAAIFK